MRIKKTILKRFQSDARFRLEIALALGVSESTARRYIADNSDDLTKASALAVFSKETGLTNDQLLESIPVDRKVKAIG